MLFDNFLVNAYFGFLEKEKMVHFDDFCADDKTDAFIESYLEISKDYPDDVLEKKKTLSKTLLDRLRKIRFFGLSIPEIYGGAGLDLKQYLKVVEAVAPQSLSLGFTALAHLSIGVKGIVLFGNEAQKRKYLPAAATGKMIFSYALTEPKTGSDARNIETHARLSADGLFYLINGYKTYITNANYAGAMTVFAQMDPDRPGNLGAFIVETAWDGVSVGKEMPKMGLKASSTATVHFKDVKVPVENMLGRAGDGFKIAMTILNYGRLALGAASAGMMKKSLADMRKRSAARKQFGLPINRFELIQEKMVTARVNSCVVSAMTTMTAGMLADNPLAPVAVESSHCKLFGTTRAWNTLYDALQLAGGSGYLSTQPYEQRLRDFRVTTIFEGTTEIHSIYPALYMLRKLNRHLKSLSGGRLPKIHFLIRALLKRATVILSFPDKDMKRAARLGASISRKIRFLLIAGLLFYGEKVLQKQFFLRNISQLSVYFFGITAMLSKINTAKAKGLPVAEDMAILSYFTHEARQYSKNINFMFFEYKERLHHRLFSKLMR